MLKREKISPLFLLFIFVLGCSSVVGRATPVAQTEKTDDTSMKDFDSVTFNAPGILEIVQGETEAIEISGDPAFVSAIRVEVKDRELKISAQSELPSNASVTYKVFAKNVNAIVLNSFGVVKIPALKTDHLAVEINGSGRIQAGEVAAKTLMVNVNGGGSFSADAIKSALAEFSSRGAGNISIVGGTADKLNLEMESGTFIGEDFKSLSAVVTVNGTGAALVWVVKKLDVTVNGAGSVTYYGEPTMNMSMNGGGQIRGGGRK